MSSSQTHRREKDCQQRLVDELVRKYYKKTEPSPVLRDILQKSEDSSLLIQALRRQVSLVKCRSQAFEDSQITIYDRALLVLSKYGDDPEGLGALELYLTEFLGVVPIGAVSEGKDIVVKHIGLQSVLSKSAASEKVTRKSSVSERRSKSESGRRAHTAPRPDHGYRERRIKSSASTSSDDAQLLHEKVERILDVYRKAKDEFYNKKQSDGMEDPSSVRFLRDTAENALNYLHSHGLQDHKLVPELESVFRSARDKATELSGGRKRRFEETASSHSHSRSRNLKRRRGLVDSYRP
ncbi:hypothetical protein ASPWEDRAFT_182342 [Aspergillus wentii DTO 134E9]|uniref:Uncharacterized protein n=1 Tax=Aspergillus wentii DTO 134E9 TaxID=1073089 RepID=A0A1L9RRD2_ASPWE|nr:uncharacterized protein ASPWEDRAFT_182342 [Aspergillus wentii DTO 134E9]KAI9930323.1 hypothetical protein MW887_011075 [Aspergillus wentii]OJJ37474.1 hypothetical protein ASPWEDRAFT_182342 [Aspergillus wentii DTO 134E9]